MTIHVIIVLQYYMPCLSQLLLLNIRNYNPIFSRREITLHDVLITIFFFTVKEFKEWFYTNCVP